MSRKWWLTGSGYVELQIDEEDAQIGYHSGPCDDDIKELRQKDYIAAQLKDLDPHNVRLTLKDSGAYSDEELLDHDQNLTRLLFTACADIFDGEGDDVSPEEMA